MFYESLFHLLFNLALLGLVLAFIVGIILTLVEDYRLLRALRRKEEAEAEAAARYRRTLP